MMTDNGYRVIRLPLNASNPVIEKDEYPGDGGFMECDVCVGQVPWFRIENPPYIIKHDSYCLLCGQQYYFESLGDVREEQNRQFENYWANQPAKKVLAAMRPRSLTKMEKLLEEWRVNLGD